MLRLWLSWSLVLLAAAALVLGGIVACEERTTQTFNFPNARCVTFVNVGGDLVEISGGVGTTVTVDGESFKFGPDCSVTKVSTTTTTGGTP